MKLSGHSLTEDAVDRYNHTWGVVLLLTISATTWLLPQLPYVHQSKAEDAPRYQANCITPRKFTEDKVAYAHSVCLQAFTHALQHYEQANNKTMSPATIYLADPEIPSSNKFRPTPTTETSKEDYKTQRAKTAISSRLPLITFVLAVFLKLPYILWTLLSSCSETGPSQILRSVEAAQLMDAGVRSGVNQEIILAISYSKHPQSYISTVAYLFFKLLTIVVAIGGFFVLNSYLLPATATLENGASVSQLKTAHDYSNTLYFCEFPILHIHHSSHYSIHCVFTLDATSIGPSKSPDTAEHDFVFLRLYDVLHIILLFVFAKLAVLNILNFLVWVIKLSPGPFRNRTFSNAKLPLDLYLLLLMARQNIGFLAARNLELGLSSEYRGEAKIGEELRGLEE
ncbi:hypothetical protein BsWGS_26174 [Bradybaena similaris]